MKKSSPLWIPLMILWLLFNMVLFFSYEVVVYIAFWPWNREMYRYLMGTIQTAWVDVIASAFNKTNLITTGQMPTDPTKPAIILCNHQIDADWWFLWELVRRRGGGGNLKICLKDEIKYIPILGWGLALFEFLFVKRNVEHDRCHVTQHMQRFVNEKFPFWMLIFPEGTTIHSEYIEKSHRFALKSNRPQLTHLLLPRTSGLETMLAACVDMKPDIYDLTMAYPSYSGEIPTSAMGYSRHIDNEIPSIKDLLFGMKINEIHFHGKKYSFNEVYKNEKYILDNIWKEKEDLLNDFIQNKCFQSKHDQYMKILSPKTSFTIISKLWITAIFAILLSPVILILAVPCYLILGFLSLGFCIVKTKLE